MVKTSVAFASLALAAATFSPAAEAGSSTSSAISDSIGASIVGISGSLTTSSNSSSTKDVAQGDYRIVDIAAAEPRPGLGAHVRLTLQRERAAGEAAGAHDTLFLTLPQATFESTGLGRDQRVAATHRSYGIEFARADTKQAFFLVLEDHWLQELASRPVVL
jgi:hypothetical protein